MSCRPIPQRAVRSAPVVPMPILLHQYLRLLQGREHLSVEMSTPQPVDDLISSMKPPCHTLPTFSISSRTLHLDWVVVGMFYEAVHWIETYLATQCIHSKSHSERGSRTASIERLRDEPALTGDYGVLRVESENARTPLIDRGAGITAPRSQPAARNRPCHFHPHSLLRFLLRLRQPWG